MKPESPDEPRSPKHRLASTPNNLAQRVLQWLLPLIARIQCAPAVRRFRERVVPRLAAVQDKLPLSRSPRVRSMQAGAALAAVGALGISITGVSSGTEEPEQRNVQEAVQITPMRVPAPVPAPVPAQPAPQVQAAPEQAPAAPAPAPEQQTTPQAGPAGVPKPKTEEDIPAGPPVDGIDVSNYNGDINWKKVAEDGKQFTFVLATDGTSFTNPKYSEQYKGAKEAGLVAGAYHFARPSWSSAEVQADRFLQVADYQADGKTLPPVLDLETDPKGGGCYGLSQADMQLWVETFNNKVKERTGKDAIMYANPSFWRQCMGGTDKFGDQPLWLASYGVDNPSVPNGFDGWDFWQYTDKGKVAGIGGSTDLNKYQHGIDRLKFLAGN